MISQLVLISKMGQTAVATTATILKTESGVENVLTAIRKYPIRQAIHVRIIAIKKIKEVFIMAEGRECWDCFYHKTLGYGMYECRRTGRSVNGDDTCSNFISDESSNACWECEYFGTHNCGSIFEKENYCERKKRVVDPYGLACSSFVKG